MAGLKKWLLSQLIVVIILGFTLPELSFSQISNFKITGAKKNELDTLSLETSKKITEETAGLLETEIDPTKYILGPNDHLIISIFAPISQEFDVIISPEGKIIIPDAGVISLKNLSLAQADSLIKEKIKKNYRTNEVYVLLKKIRKFKVIVGGNVSKPAIVAATALDRVSEVIDRAGGFKFNASIRHITLKRASDDQIVSVDLLKFFMLGDKDANPYVNGGDVVNVPSMNDQDFIEILGDVVEPDKFEYKTGDSLSTLIKYAHGFLPSAKLDSIEIVRFSGNHAGIDRWFIDVRNWKEKLYSGLFLNGNIALESGDRVYVRNKEDWEDDKYVTLKGEVKHPGVYAIKEGVTRVKDVLDMAGGLNPEASIENTVLFRTQEEKVEDKQLKRLQTIPYSEMSETEYQYFTARILEQKGVMAIDFKKVFEDNKGYDNALLFDKDSIFIPRQKYYVNVQGRVITPGLVAYRENYTYLNYIEAAGGFAYRADDDETFIHKARGEQFLAKDMNYTIEPGDNILVPPQKPSTFWKDINTSLQITVSLLGIVVVILSSLSQMK